MNETVRAAAAAVLDAQILTIIEEWRATGNASASAIDAAFVATARHQLEYNSAYRAYAQSFGAASVTPKTWTEIVPVPAAAFKTRAFASFPLTSASTFFQTSGTTTNAPGRHYFEHLALYDAAASSMFERCILGPRGFKPPLVMINLTPPRAQFPHSSLGYMAAQFAAKYDPSGGTECIEGTQLDFVKLQRALTEAAARNEPVIMLGTALAYAQLLASHPLPFAVTAPLCIIETGGFKGQSTTIDRAQLYAGLRRVFGVDDAAISAEFGMTELSSQYYDRTPSATASMSREQSELRVKIAPPWLRYRIVNAAGTPAAADEVGVLQHFDLANRASVVAIETEDLALAVPGGFILLGREVGAELRGCSLTAESLQARLAKPA